MSESRNHKSQPLTVKPFEKQDKTKESVSLSSANQVIASNIRPFNGALAFEVANPDSDLSGDATINLQLSVSGQNWVQAVDINGDNITYTLSSGNTIADSISGIPEGVYMQIVVVENLTGTLIVSTLK